MSHASHHVESFLSWSSLRLHTRNLRAPDLLFSRIQTLLPSPALHEQQYPEIWIETITDSL